jgi:PAS domain S-box-containing protein
MPDQTPKTDVQEKSAELPSSDVKEHALALLAQWQTLFDAAPLGIYLVDSDFRLRAINPTARPFFGDIPDLIGRNFDEVTHVLWCEEYADEIVRLFRHTLKTGEPYITPERIEERRDRGGTEYYEWEIHRIPLSEGRDGVVCYFRDISAQVLARAEIAESEEQRRRTAEGLRAIAARARCLLWYAEVEDRGEPALHWTLRVADEEAARRFLPVIMPFGHSYGRALSEARLPEDRARMVWGDEEIRAGRSYRQEFRVRDASGNIRWLTEDVQIEEVGPNRWYAVGVCVDTTERKRAEEERERHLAEIETLNNRLQRAMTETHHRVKNNLQLISAMIDLQRNTCEERVPISEFERLSANVRTLSVIHDILTQEAKEGSGQETLSVKAVLDRLLQELAQTTGGHPLVSAIDDARLAGRQTTTLALVTNELVSNALKHGKGQTEVYFKTNGNSATLAICDNGPGFPAGFDARTAAHTGLELVENIVQWDLRGQIAYDNRSQGGAQITVTFPIQTHQKA